MFTSLQSWIRRRDSGTRGENWDPVTIVVMGAIGSGKTQFINLAGRSNQAIGVNSKSRAAEVRLADELTLGRRSVVLIDTPGFDGISLSSTDVLKKVEVFLATTYGEGHGLDGAIYLHRADDDQFAGITERDLGLLDGLCRRMANVIIVANVWAGVPRNAAGACENKPPATSPKLTSGGGPRTAHYYNTAQSAHSIIRMITKNCPVVGLVGGEVMDEFEYIVDAGTGEAANRELEERIRRHRADLERVQKAMVETLGEVNEKATQKLEERIRHHQDELKEVRKETMELLKGMNEETRRELEEHIEQHQDELREVGEEMREVLTDMHRATEKDLEGYTARLPQITLKKTLGEQLGGPEELEEIIRDSYTKWKGTPEEMMEMLEKAGKEARKNLEEGTERYRAEVEDSLEKMMETLREMGDETNKELKEWARTVLCGN